MKTIQELYNEVMADNELKKAFIASFTDGTAQKLIKEHGCDASVEDVQAFLKEKAGDDKPLSADELQDAAGGCKKPETWDCSIQCLMTMYPLC